MNRTKRTSNTNPQLIKPIIILLLGMLFLVPAFSQTKRNTALYLSFEYAHTNTDITKGNNPDGLGFEFHAFFNRRSFFQPVAEISYSAYLPDDKVGRLNPDGTGTESIGSMFNILGGAAIVPWPYTYVSVVAGPSFPDIGGGPRLALKPSLGFFFPKNQRFSLKFSYLKLYNREKTTGQDFESATFAFGVRLY